MNFTIREVTTCLEQWAPLALQEDYDNAGLLCGNSNWTCTGAMICLDSTPEVIQEAIQKGCNLVVAHHPIVFSGIKKLTGKNYIERALILAIKNDIAIYAIHTNLDNVHTGVNRKIGDMLGIKNPSILRSAEGHLLQLSVYVPNDHASQVMEALFSAGAGAIGKYDNCSFALEGTGTFRPGEDTNPFSGEIGVRRYEAETRIETILPFWKKAAVYKALVEAHPYEEVAYNFVKLENPLQETGSGMVGNFEQPISTNQLLHKIKEIFGGTLRHTAILDDQISRIAWCGGSGSFLLKDAISAGAQVFLTSDFKYHQFFDADNRILIIDIGHFENEQFTMQLIYEHLKDNFPNFAGCLTSVQTNPIHYL
jgi:dinuclear metal center YbgI/SA1388 family protein